MGGIALAGLFVVVAACSPDRAPSERLAQHGAALTVQQAKLAAIGGRCVALSGNTAVVTSPASSGASVFVRSGTSWALQQTLGGLQSSETCAVAIDGDTAAIGGYDNGNNVAYVFTRSGATWTQQAMLLSQQVSSGGASQSIGSISLSGDLLLVGIPQAKDVAMYTRSGATWTEGSALRTLVTGGVAGADVVDFGLSIAATADTVWLTSRQAVFRYTRTANIVTFTDYLGLTAYGLSVALSGNIGIVGSPQSATAGSATVFTRSGTTWSSTVTLAPSGGVSGDGFGTSVALSGDTALIGSPMDDDKGSDSGSAFVFVLSGGTWTERDKIVPADGTANANFGRAVALQSGTALIGAPGFEGSSILGDAYVFLIGDPNGTACTVGTSCASGQCVEGVCCDSACTSPCQSCLASRKVSGANGACGVIAAATDPKSACADQGAASCGTNGMCNGTSTTCAIYANTTVCLAAACASPTSENPEDRCDGVGACIATAAKPCATGYACVTGACRTTCTDDTHCSTGYSCHTASSQCRKNAGAQCDAATECASGFCVDSVCCATACNGTCQACSATLKTTGADGVCGDAKIDTDPRSSCTDQGAASCGNNGFCNGAGACARYPSGTSCGTGTCVGTTFNAATSCDGNGNCVANAGSTECAPHVCAAPGGCKKPCVGDGDCISGYECHVASGNCRKAEGASCATPLDCASDFCVDGFCCQTACTGACQACSAALKTTGIDGTCGPSKLGMDPHEDCADQGASSCGTSGSCDGAGACAFYGLVAQCAAGSCASEASENPPDFCSGSGSCVPTTATPCLTGYACTGGACKTTCAVAGDCATGYGCHVVSGQCRKLAGAACTAASDCASGFCADGVCCDAACTGTCQACSAALKQGGTADGTCGPARGNTDPHDHCADAGAASCGFNGACDGAGACARYASGTSCGVGTCDGSKLTASATCDGSGVCKMTATVVECAPYACAATGCKSPCAADADCVTGNFCANGACVPQRPVAGTCTRAGECQNGQCFDGVCCGTVCNSPCMACSSAAKGQGDDGVCGNAASGLDPHDDCAPDPGFPASCKADGACDGSGKCRAFARLGTACGTTACSGGRISGSLCDGIGTCKAGSEVACDPFGCSGNECGSKCTSNAFCALGAICGPAGVCVAQKQLGEACGTDGECNSGYCVDGICCNAICTGQCEACDSAASKGKCVPVTGAPHGKRATCTGTGEACAGTCDGANPATCTYPGASTICGEGKACDKGQCVQVRAICKDAQTSSAPGGAEASCLPFACDSAPGVCRQACAASSECAAGYLCEAPRCVPLTTPEIGDDGGGCGCRVTGATPNGAGFALGIGALIAARMRRRRAVAVPSVES